MFRSDLERLFSYHAYIMGDPTPSNFSRLVALESAQGAQGDMRIHSLVSVHGASEQVTPHLGSVVCDLEARPCLQLLPIGLVQVSTYVLSCQHGASRTYPPAKNLSGWGYHH